MEILGVCFLLVLVGFVFDWIYVRLRLAQLISQQRELGRRVDTLELERALSRRAPASDVPGRVREGLGGAATPGVLGELPRRTLHGAPSADADAVEPTATGEDHGQALPRGANQPPTGFGATPRPAAFPSNPESLRLTVGSPEDSKRGRVLTEAERLPVFSPDNERNEARSLALAGGALGAIFLIIGVGFGLKVVIDAGLFGPAVRVALASGFGVVLLGLGARARGGSPRVAEALSVAGVVIQYGAAFAGSVLYTLWPQPLGFVLLSALTVASLAVSVLARWRTMVWAAMIGAALTPVLLGSDTPQHVFFLGYTALVTTAVVGVALRRGWHDVLVGHALVFGALLAGWSLTTLGDVPAWLGIGGVGLCLGGPVIVGLMLREEARSPVWLLGHVLALGLVIGVWVDPATEATWVAAAVAVALAVGPGLLVARVGKVAGAGWLAHLGAAYATILFAVAVSPRGTVAVSAWVFGFVVGLPALLAVAARGREGTPAPWIPLALVPAMLASLSAFDMAYPVAAASAVVLLAGLPSLLFHAPAIATSSLVAGASGLALAAARSDDSLLHVAVGLGMTSAGLVVSAVFSSRTLLLPRLASLFVVLPILAGLVTWQQLGDGAPSWLVASYLALLLTLWRVQGGAAPWLEELAATGALLALLVGIVLAVDSWFLFAFAAGASGVAAALATALCLPGLGVAAVLAGVASLCGLVIGGAFGASLGPGMSTLAWCLAASAAVGATYANRRITLRMHLTAVGLVAWPSLAVLFGLGFVHEATGFVAGSTTSDTRWFLPAARSVAWGAYGVLLLVGGVVAKGRPLRFAGAAIVSIAAVKVFLFDMWMLDGWARVASFLGLGASLMGSAFLFERMVLRDATPAPGATE